MKCRDVPGLWRTLFTVYLQHVSGAFLDEHSARASRQTRTVCMYRTTTSSKWQRKILLWGYTIAVDSTGLVVAMLLALIPLCERCSRLRSIRLQCSF